MRRSQQNISFSQTCFKLTPRIGKEQLPAAIRIQQENPIRALHEQITKHRREQRSGAPIDQPIPGTQTVRIGTGVYRRQQISVVVFSHEQQPES